MNRLSLSRKLLLGRLLTRSGDQAWDFALPLVLLFLFPNQLRIAALYFLIVRFLHTLCLPHVAQYIDRWSRKKAVKFGVYLQLAGVLIGTASIYFLFQMDRTDFDWIDSASWGLASIFVMGGLLSSLGSAFMDISVANDLVPSSIPEADMAIFNSRLRQVDLLTEVASPFVAGFILLIDQSHLTGFYLLAFWNLISFFPELGLLNSIFRDRPDLSEKPVHVGSQLQKSIFLKFTEGWRAFFKQPVALVCLAYAILWFSALSPHGVLLAAFLKDGWDLPEWGIGIFRGLGALFGLLATLLYPRIVQHFGLHGGTQKFIYFQAATLLLGLGLFLSAESLRAQIGFLAMILFSRIGLYGFSLGEMQIRQLEIDSQVRGEVNGFASALTGFATLVLYGLGALLPETEDFRILVIASVAFVCLAALTYQFWLHQSSKKIGRVRPTGSEGRL